VSNNPARLGSVLLHDHPLAVAGGQEAQSQLVGREDGTVDDERPRHGGAQAAPQHGEPLLPDAPPEAVDDAAVPGGRERLRLQPRLDHVQRVAADPAGDAGEAAGHEHRRQALAAAAPAPRVQPLPGVLVRPEVDAVRRRVAERGHREPAVDATEPLPPEDVAGHVHGAVVVARAPVLVPRRLQLQPDLDELDGGQDERLQRPRADAGDGHARVGRRLGGGALLAERPRQDRVDLEHHRILQRDSKQRAFQLSDEQSKCNSQLHVAENAARPCEVDCHKFTTDDLS